MPLPEPEEREKALVFLRRLPQQQWREGARAYESAPNDAECSNCTCLAALVCSLASTAHPTTRGCRRRRRRRRCRGGRRPAREAGGTSVQYQRDDRW